MKWDPGFGWTYQKYFDGLRSFQESGYSISPLCDFKNFPEKKVLFLRHDVDFDLEVAYRLGKAEHRMGIRSSFYFRLHASGYNLLSASNIQRVLELQSFGHEISVHIDHGLSYFRGDEFLWCQNQIRIFEDIFGLTVRGFSSHEPSRLNGVEVADKIKSGLSLSYHAYDHTFTSNMKYISDSTKRWREKPFYDYINEHTQLQVLIHPIWWYQNLAQESY
jgi:hypothetical protein